MKWYRLDNAAKVFPSVASTKNTSVYRISVLMTETVDKTLLQKSVEHIMPRFPMLFVQLRRGVFWNYFDANSQTFIVEEESSDPCRTIHPKVNNGYMMRIFYFNKRISLEMFHSLTDGVGALEFLKSLLYYYMTFSGHTINPEDKVLLVDDGLQVNDYEDSFSHFYDAQPGGLPKQEKAYRIRGTRFENYGTNVITGTMNTSALHAVAKANNSTITAYLVALLIVSICKTRIKYGWHRRPVVVSVPVNLRRVFPSKTLRNFFGVVNVDARPSKDISMESILGHINESLKEKTQRENLVKVIVSNLKYETNVFAKGVPLFFKEAFIGIGYCLFSEIKKTISLSNLGNLALPADMAPMIEQVDTLLYLTKRSPINCGVCAVNDRISISFTRTIEETDIIQYFFSYLAEHDGLDITVHSNDWGLHDEPDEM